jgi:Raf kinase inhibitor-like YbhB/YbcL family protein
MKAQQNSTADTIAVHETLHVSSSAFQDGQPVPQKYSCEGQNISPAVSWGKIRDAKSYAMVVEDPDAPSGMFVHWVIYNIPATEHGLAENIPTEATLPNGTVQGLNGAHKVGYTGPCPPGGKPHRYFFKVFALDQTLNLTGDVDHDRLLSAIPGHIVAQGQTIGTYQR